MMTILKACFQKLLRIAKNAVALLKPAPGWSGLKRWLLQIVTLVSLLGIGAFLFVTLGLAPIRASSGHWPITSWFLHSAMARSVATQSMMIEVPALDDPGMVIKGATHYDLGCYPCHGKPSLHNPRIALKMTPNPPYLPPIIHEWDPQELFYIVKHGVKFTGMPAWPSQQRDDEVWAMVAFLQKFPELTEREYDRLVNGDDALPESKTNSQGFDVKNDEKDADTVPLQGLGGRKGFAQSIINSCGRCHGKEGQGREAGVAPKLAGQRPEYLEKALVAFASGERHSGIMEPIAAGLNADETREVARYYSEREASQVTLTSSASELAISRGAKLALEGLPEARIPICAECHGPGDHLRNSAYPTLAGQYADYLVQQLALFASDHRGGSEYGSLMHPIAQRLTPEQMLDIAKYYESLAVPLTTNKTVVK